MLIVRIRVRDFFAPVFTVDKVIHHARLQWARSEQRHQRDNIFKTVRLEALNQIFHTTRFQLEHRRGFGIEQHLKRLMIIQWNGIDIHQRFAFFFHARVNHIQRPFDDG